MAKDIPIRLKIRNFLIELLAGDSTILLNVSFTVRAKAKTESALTIRVENAKGCLLRKLNFDMQKMQGKNEILIEQWKD